MIYAVKNRNTGKYVTGTDFSRGKPRQIMATNRAPLLLGDYGAEDSGTVSAEMLRRGISTRRYKLVPVEVREIEQQRQQAPPERKPLPAGYYNMDCMAALPLFPDDFFDIAVIDAPYGIGADNMAMGTNKTRKKNGYPAESTAERVKKSRKENGAGKWDNQVPPPEYFTELFRVSKHCIIWGGNYYDLPPTRGVIVWDKLQPWEAFSQVEIAWTDYDRPAAIVKLSNTGGANPCMDIIPANMSLLQATNDLTREEGEDQIERFKALAEAFPLEDGKPYDFIIIDNPPDLGLNVINALAVSDDVIVPTKIDAWALEGLDVIIEQVGQMQQLNSRLRFRGVLPTMWQNSDANVSGLEWLQEKGYKVFDSKIWYGAKAAESTFFCKPIVEYAPRSWTAIRYRKFVAEYMAEIEAEKAADLQEGKGVQ